MAGPGGTSAMGFWDLLARAPQKVLGQFKALANHVREIRRDAEQWAKTQRDPTLGKSVATSEAAHQKLAGALGRVRDAAKNLKASIAGTPENLEKMQAAAARAAEASRNLAQAYGYLFGKLKGFAMGGLSGTTIGELWSTQMGFLRREITQLFLPAIQQVVMWQKQLVGWFRSLSGEQQNAIGKWSMIVTGMLGFLTIGPKVVGVVKAIRTAMMAMGAANPFMLLIAVIGGFMAASESGRESLMAIGETMMAAFSVVGDMLERVVLPVLETIAELLSGVTGQVALFGVVMAAVGYKVYGAVMMMVTSMTMLQGALGIVGIAFVGLMALMGRSKSAFQQVTEDAAKAVKSGRMTKEEALEQAKQKAEEQAFEESEGIGSNALKRAALKARYGFDLDDEELARRFREDREKELYDEASGKIERADKGRKGRNELVLAKTGFEGISDSWKRLQQAGLKNDPMLKETKDVKKAIEVTNKLIEGTNKLIEKFGFKIPPLVAP